MMTFSEFGRRLLEKRAVTGTRSPARGRPHVHHLGGGKLRSGLVGAHPSLAPADLEDGDIKYGTDFRSVYATLLQDWLKTPTSATAAILGRQFNTLPLIG